MCACYMHASTHLRSRDLPRAAIFVQGHHRGCNFDFAVETYGDVHSREKCCVGFYPTCPCVFLFWNFNFLWLYHCICCWSVLGKSSAFLVVSVLSIFDNKLFDSVIRMLCILLSICNTTDDKQHGLFVPLFSFLYRSIFTIAIVVRYFSVIAANRASSMVRVRVFSFRFVLVNRLASLRFLAFLTYR